MLTKLVQVHAVMLWTGLVLHEVGAVFRRPQAGLEGPPVDEDVVHRLYRPQSVLGLVVSDVSAGAGALEAKRSKADSEGA